MSTSLNTAGVANAHSLIAQGKVNTGTWSLSPDEENKLLGPNGDDWQNYSKWFLAQHPDKSEKTKSRFGYPFGKNGEVYRNAVVSAKGRAAGQGAAEVEAACSSLLDMMDKKSGQPAVAKDAQCVRAYSLLEIKSIDEDQRTFEGIATTPSTDRMDDIVEPMGAQFTLPIPMLWQHGRGSIADPVGQITSARATSSGIYVKGQMQKPAADYPQSLRDDLNKAWVLVRDKLVRGLSIGFNSLESEPIKGSFGNRYTKWDWLELSAVTIAANQDASIQTIKSLSLIERGITPVRVVKAIPLGPKPGVFRLDRRQ